MPSDKQTAQRCELRANADMLAALDACLLEHLDIDDVRVFVLYRDAVPAHGCREDDQSRDNKSKANE